MTDKDFIELTRSLLRGVLDLDGAIWVNGGEDVDGKPIPCLAERIHKFLNDLADSEKPRLTECAKCADTYGEEIESLSTKLSLAITRIKEMHSTECQLWRQAQTIPNDTFASIVEKVLDYEVHKTVTFLNEIETTVPKED